MAVHRRRSISLRSGNEFQSGYGRKADRFAIDHHERGQVDELERYLSGKNGSDVCDTADACHQCIEEAARQMTDRAFENKYKCARCGGTGEEPEATGGTLDILACLQKHIDDLSVPRDQHDAMAAAASVIEQLSKTIRRHRQDRPYVDGFSDGFDAAIERMKPSIVNLKEQLE